MTASPIKHPATCALILAGAVMRKMIVADFRSFRHHRDHWFIAYWRGVPGTMAAGNSDGMTIVAAPKGYGPTRWW
jgi:hypothetical protein